MARKVEVESWRRLVGSTSVAPSNAPANPSRRRRSTRLEAESVEDDGGEGDGGSGLGRSGRGARPNRTPYTSCRKSSAGRDARKLSDVTPPPLPEDEEEWPAVAERESKGSGDGQGEWDGEFGGVLGNRRKGMDAGLRGAGAGISESMAAVSVET